MKALQIIAPNTLAMVDVPEPVAGLGQVLLRIERIGYCGSDLATFRGSNPLIQYPRIPGHEIAARVAGRGPGVPATIVDGTLVTALPYTACGHCPSCRAGRVNACRDNQTLGVQRDGALTQYLVLPWEKLLHRPRLTAIEHAFIEPLSVGFHAVQRGRVEAKDTVLVLGCGMIGLGAIAGAGLFRKARVIAVDIDDAKLALARQAGAAAAINSQQQDLAHEAAQLTGGDGPGVVIEAVGSPATFTAAVDLVAHTGRVVYIGYAKAPVTYQSKHFILKELDILGSRNATRENFEQVADLLESGAYPVAATLSQTVPFADAASALEQWSANPAAVTKIQVTLSS